MHHRLALFVVSIIGCGTPAHAPPNPGGGGGGGGDDDVSPADAAIDGPVQPGQLFDGRVCVLLDMRDPESCAGENAIVQVTLGGTTVTTNEDGAFQMMLSGPALEWDVAMPGVVVHSKMKYDGHAKTLAIHKSNYDHLLATNGLTTIAGQGAMVLRFSSDAPTGLSVSLANPAHSTRYDTDTADVWSTAVGTGAHNVAWFAGESPGAQTILVSTSDETTDLERTFEADVLRWETFRPAF